VPLPEVSDADWRHDGTIPPICHAIAAARDAAMMHSPWEQELEVFLNPADAKAFAPFTRVRGLPLKTSLGVPEGRVFIFDRHRMRYLPDGALDS
jgi:hypothetical protein